MFIGGMSNNYTIPISMVGRVTPVNTDNSVDSSSAVKPTTECKTCQNRKYVDGSDENNVSFKTPGKIKPGESFAKVSAHERQHVTNAISKGNKPNAKLINASVSYKMGICPECGRSYVAGGLTRTQIRYSEDNKYEKNRKSFEADALIGSNFDAAI